MNLDRQAVISIDFCGANIFVIMLTCKYKFFVSCISKIDNFCYRSIFFKAKMRKLVHYYWLYFEMFQYISKNSRRFYI